MRGTSLHFSLELSRALEKAVAEPSSERTVVAGSPSALNRGGAADLLL